MSRIRQVKTQRRSLLAALAASIGALSVSRAAFARAGSEQRPQVRDPEAIDLKRVGAERRVAAIRHSDGTYFVTSRAGETRSFSEFDLRFKTDSGARGPGANAPVLLAAGTRGDRATIVFSTPDEIGRSIEWEAATKAPSDPNRTFNGEAE